MPTAGPPSVAAVVNQSDLSPRAPAKASPVSDTSWSEPTRVMAVTRPPQSPYAVAGGDADGHRVPRLGQVASMVDTGTDAVQVWLGLQAPGTQTPSPVSGTAGKAPGAV